MVDFRVQKSNIVRIKTISYPTLEKKRKEKKKKKKKKKKKIQKKKKKKKKEKKKKRGAEDLGGIEVPHGTFELMLSLELLIIDLKLRVAA